MSLRAILHSNGQIAEFDGDGILLSNADDARDPMLASCVASWVALRESRMAPFLPKLDTLIAAVG